MECYFKKWFRISIYLNVNPNFTSLKHLISKTDSTAIKYSGQGSFKGGGGGGWNAILKNGFGFLYILM